MPLLTPPLHGVCAIITNSDGKLLVGLRIASHGAGSWQLPGGHVEQNEGILACTAREVEEETGLRVQPTRVVDTTYDLFSGHDKHYVTWFVLCDLKDADATPKNMEPSKCSRWEWMALDDVRALTLFLPLRQLLGRYPSLSAVTNKGVGPVIKLPPSRGGGIINIEWTTTSRSQHASDDTCHDCHAVHLLLAPRRDLVICDASPLDVSDCFSVVVCGPDGRHRGWPLGRDVAFLDDAGEPVKSLLGMFPDATGGHATPFIGMPSTTAGPLSNERRLVSPPALLPASKKQRNAEMSSLDRRPRLVAQNRKLRHLKGISLRNLSLDDPSASSASATASASLANSLNGAGAHHDILSHTLPLKASLSPHLPSAAVTRHNKLRKLVETSVAQVFFSLHVDEEAEPVYVSELRQPSANFDFPHFDLTTQPPPISRSSQVTVRIWSKRPGQEAWIFVLNHVVDLRHLNFIGSLIDRRFPPNALVFHLVDGLYSLDFPPRTVDAKQAPSVATSSYSSLMKLANLESSVRDALETRDDLVAQINAVLDQSPPDATDSALEDVARAEKYVAKQRRALRQAESRRHDLAASLVARRAAIRAGREAHARAEAEMSGHRDRLAASKALLDRTAEQIHGQRRRICSDLADIFPITPERDAPPLSFRICNLPLPNSRYDATSADEHVLSAALGLAALLTRHLQLYLSHPLPYPLCPYGSRSLVRDDISHLSDSANNNNNNNNNNNHNTNNKSQPSPRREFPLYLPRGGSTTGQWRFEYGWFLLNKDIETLCASQGLRVVDIRHSLPNLKYLLYVCSAGSRDLPERHRGGVKGLWAGSLRGMARGGVDGNAADVDGDETNSRLLLSVDGKLTPKADEEDVAG
ncbi:hypothetical protein L249_0694 [Ophiocordyceps polyrhachis-furcata BCC 54312]|uniref:Autophagy-related protein 14 n=1 Tax=Ophiocordyceps polyrhachis-furcata BCC 54312 TaxID=1330021 RepID=A0A367LF76_9HYPO|nr:hypothetical protein L249_0694 [Ophiocordyceps polyrhachis-furcata BCC 54312]